ncbi:MAG: sulfatase [Isosphaeraceae bacterium]
MKFTLSAAAVIVTIIGQANGASRADQPNVVLMIADDLAWDDVGAFGNPKVSTPNIDRLAREGLKFDRAFLTCSSCSPSRASIITGRYPHNTDAEELHWPLPGKQVTFVEKLKADGYWTAAAGKWHMGDAIKGRFNLVREADPSGFQLRKGKTRLTTAAKGDAASGCDQWVSTLRDRPRDQPFFLWLASLDPHRDYEPGTLDPPHRPEDVVVPAVLPDLPEVRKDLAMYYDEIGRLDRHVGAVLDELDRQGVADQTLVLFLSDNGRPFPRCKTTMYDDGIKTPLIARWPSRIKPGTTCGALVSSIDIAPTVLELAGVAKPSTVQGASFATLLSDPTASIQKYIFAEHNWHDYLARGRAVRSKQFKYIRNYDHEVANTPPADAVRSPTFQAMRRLRDEGRLPAVLMSCFNKPRPEEELYDLDADPHEWHNLALDPRHAETLATLRTVLNDWENANDDQPPAVLSSDEFDRETGTPLPNRARPRALKGPRAAAP